MIGAVAIVQPVHQHAYEAAVAAQEGRLLGTFLTGIYDTGRGWLDPRLRASLPRNVAERLERDLRRRRHPELNPEHVVTIARYHALATVWRRLGGYGDLDSWAHDRFDAAAARMLHRLPSIRLVHGFEGSALATFRAAKRAGAATVLDAANAHEYALAALGEVEGVRTERVRAERALADYVLAPSPFVGSCLLAHGVPAAKIVELPYGVDAGLFAPAPRLDRRFRVLFVGRIGLRKGVRYLLEAWRRLALPGAELVLVGEADAAGAAILREYDGTCRWVGPRPKYEVHRFYRESDVFVFPSLAEGSALVTYEAMAAGLPVVTTRCSGSVVRDGVDGLLVPARAVAPLAEAISRLHANGQVRRAMGLRGQALVQSRYTWLHYRERLRRVYSAVLAGRPPQAELAERKVA